MNKKMPHQVKRTPDRASDPMKHTKRPQLDYITSFCWLTRRKSYDAYDPERGCGPIGYIR